VDIRAYQVAHWSLDICRRDLPLIRSIEHALNLQPGELRRGVPLLRLLAQVPKTFPEATKGCTRDGPHSLHGFNRLCYS
jgi:hypothetical protein